MLRVAVAIGEDAEPLGAADAMLDGDAEAGEAAVIVLFVVAELAALWLLVGDVEVRVVLVVALVGAVGMAARPRGQGRARAAKREVEVAREIRTAR